MSAAANTMAIPAGATTRGIAHEAFDAIVAENQQRIYRVLMALVRDPDLAAQLTQDCFVRAYEKRASFRGESSVSTWLTRIAVNLARDHARNRRHGFWKKLFAGRGSDELGDAFDSLPAHQASPERHVLAREQASTVWDIVATLSHQQREVFVLRFSEEMSLQEIAASLDLQIGSVKSHLSRAVTYVRAQLKERYRETALER